jgi:hypothetical protein
MAKSKIPDSNVKIRTFAKDELDLLVDEISTFRPDQKVRDGAVMGALILAARRSPIESVSAVLATYWDKEADLVAALAAAAAAARDLEA